MAPRQFLILLAVVSSSTGARAGTYGDAGIGFKMDFKPFEPYCSTTGRDGGSGGARGLKPPYSCGPLLNFFLASYLTTGNYTIDSPYQVNLVNLVHDLESGAIASGGFNDSAAGQAPDAVFGLIMCYADRNSTECQNCLQKPTSKVQLICPYSREMKAFDDTCVIRYSN
ncbi:unnamed protein product [Urochloa decumbens]|uniref:Gnk2-homologous domain-containing protein n=1 Tax=Urochloa decumbens TaxID=240449 RepID=A0ABC9H264_9POAL